MLPKELAQYLWTLTGSHTLTGYRGATLLALLACNLNEYAPEAGDLARHCRHSPRSTYDALEHLTADNGPVIERKHPGKPARYALRRFAHLLPQKDALPGPAVAAPPQGQDEETPRRRDANHNTSETPQEPRTGSQAVCVTSPRAEKAVFSFSEGKTTAANAPSTSNESLSQIRALCDFAAHVCKIESADAALLHALESYGAERLTAALEQYHYAYTQRRREANNPAGQILAWCKKPGNMDRLPAGALRFARWQERREQLKRPQEVQPPAPMREAPAVSEAEAALARAWQLYGTGKGPKPSPELEQAARAAKKLRESAKPEARKAAPGATLEG